MINESASIDCHIVIPSQNQEAAVAEKHLGVNSRWTAVLEDLAVLRLVALKSAQKL